MDFKFTNHTPDGEGLLESLHRLDPDGFPDLIKKLMLHSDDLSEKHVSANPIKDTPDFIENVVDEWENATVTDRTPMAVTNAYIRFDRAWNSYRACVVADKVGPICDVYWKRTDQLGFLLDRKIHKTKDLDERVHLMNLFRLLIPQFIDMGEEENNLTYEKSWNKPLAAMIVKSGVLTPERVELLIRVREDFKRLPSHISKFIKNDLLKYLNEETDKISPDYLSDIDSLKTAIRNLDNYIQWHLVTDNRNTEMGKKADACFELISQEMKKVEDIQAWCLYCNLMMTGFAPIGTIDDRHLMKRRVEKRLKKNIETGKLGNAKGKKNSEAFAERLLLAAMYLENLFLEDQDCDIYTSYWTLMERNKMEEEVWKTTKGLFPFHP